VLRSFIGYTTNAQLSNIEYLMRTLERSKKQHSDTLMPEHLVLDSTCRGGMAVKGVINYIYNQAKMLNEEQRSEFLKGLKKLSLIIDDPLTLSQEADLDRTGRKVSLYDKLQFIQEMACEADFEIDCTVTVARARDISIISHVDHEWLALEDKGNDKIKVNKLHSSLGHTMVDYRCITKSSARISIQGSESVLTEYTSDPTESIGAKKERLVKVLSPHLIDSKKTRHYKNIGELQPERRRKIYQNESRINLKV